ncbi:MAG: arylsulfatase [Cyclobacteriaceae bacterium]
MRLILLLSIFSLFFGCKKPQKEATGNPSKPNIIYILADDLGYGDLGVYGQQKIKTPNIDRLARQGMLFTQHYSGSTVCAPSRSSLMSGLHTGHTPIRGNREVKPEGQEPFPDSIPVLPKMMKQAGYVTGAFGKWGLGFPGSEGEPNNFGFDQFYGYNCQRLAHIYHPEYLWNNREKVELPGNLQGKDQQYAPELIHQQTLSFIRRNRDNPFFLFVPTPIPHAELVAPDSIMKQYIGEFLPEKSYDGKDYGDPDYDFFRGPYGDQENAHAAFVAMVSILDRHVGEIMELVDSLGITENTIIMFTSDNGPHLEGGADPDYFDSNGPLQGYKRDLYEGGIRVPFIVRWPGTVKPGTKSDHISAFWDIVPTLKDLTESDYHINPDGISFLPTLKGDNLAQQEHDYLYWEFHEKGGRQAVRIGKWKAVKYEVFSGEADIELYDLSVDIGETNDLADQHPQIIEQVKTIFDTARTHNPIFKFASETYKAN